MCVSEAYAGCLCVWVCVWVCICVELWAYVSMTVYDCMYIYLLVWVYRNIFLCYGVHVYVCLLLSEYFQLQSFECFCDSVSVLHE